MIMKNNNYYVIEVEIPLTKVISIKIDAETLKETDTLCKRKGFKSRSELIREAISTYIELLKRYDRDELKKIMSSILNSNNLRKKDKTLHHI